MEPDWANLEALALSLILDKLEERIDHVWFGAVCKSWRSIAILNHQNHQFRTNILPMLFIPTESNTNEMQRRLYGIPANRVYNFGLPVDLDNKRCCGSSHGWVATMDASNGNQITLQNPFKYVAPIRLPRLEYVRKVTLSADPITSPNDYAVAAIYDGNTRLACMRAGQTFWTSVTSHCTHFTDIIFHKGLLYAVNKWNMIVSFRLHYSDELFDVVKIASNILLPESINCYTDKVYLVKSVNGDLWIVTRSFLIRVHGKDVSFNTYKLELDTEKGKVQQILKLDSLEDNVLFLGHNDSISVSASYHSKCLSKDSIYFANRSKIYNIKDGSTRHYCPYSFRRTPPPFWILPFFQWD